MPPQPAVARWRTKVLVAAGALALAGAAVAAVVASDSSPQKKGPDQDARARLLPIGQAPLRVKGTGFVPGERVKLTLGGGTDLDQTIRAGADGSFTAVFRGVNACDSVTADARGSKGSRASFNFSQVACLSP
jgi:hypothetical protein